MVADEILFGDEIALPAESLEPEIAEIGGRLMNLTSGEFLDPSEERFCIDSMDRLDWALETLGDLEREKAKREAKKRDLVGAADKKIAETDREIAAFKRRFEPEIRAFSANELIRTNSRIKTLRTFYGEVSFKSVAARLSVIDLAAALTWAREHAPSIIRVQESVTKPDVVAAVQAAEREGAIDPGEGFVERIPGGESMTIRTTAHKRGDQE